MNEDKAQTITIDDISYNIDDLNDGAKLSLQHIIKLDKDVEELVFKLDEAKVARTSFFELLKSELKQKVD
jgi:dGTP triphosphohydrolase